MTASSSTSPDALVSLEVAAAIHTECWTCGPGVTGCTHALAVDATAILRDLGPEQLADVAQAALVALVRGGRGSSPVESDERFRRTTALLARVSATVEAAGIEQLRDLVGEVAQPYGYQAEVSMRENADCVRVTLSPVAGAGRSEYVNYGLGVTALDLVGDVVTRDLIINEFRNLLDEIAGPPTTPNVVREATPATAPASSESAPRGKLTYSAVVEANRRARVETMESVGQVVPEVMRDPARWLAHVRARVLGEGGGS